MNHSAPSTSSVSELMSVSWVWSHIKTKIKIKILLGPTHPTTGCLELQGHPSGSFLNFFIAVEFWTASKDPKSQENETQGAQQTLKIDSSRPKRSRNQYSL